MMEESTRNVKPFEERLEQGVATMVALLNQWLGASGFSHSDLVNVAAWGLGEQGSIETTIISNLKNGKRNRGPSWKAVDAFAAANEAIWLWQTQGEQTAIAKLGPYSSYNLKAQDLNNAVWMLAPEDADQPLRLRHFAAIITGRLELPYLIANAFTPNEAKLASDRLTAILNQIIIENGWGAKEGIDKVLAAYPVGDKARQRRLKRLILGEIRLNHGQFQEEVTAILQMINTLRGFTPGSYGDAELRAELQAALPPAS